MSGPCLPAGSSPTEIFMDRSPPSKTCWTSVGSAKRSSPQCATRSRLRRCGRLLGPVGGRWPLLPRSGRERCWGCSSGLLWPLLRRCWQWPLPSGGRRIPCSSPCSSPVVCPDPSLETGLPRPWRLRFRLGRLSSSAWWLKTTVLGARPLWARRHSEMPAGGFRGRVLPSVLGPTRRRLSLPDNGFGLSARRGVFPAESAVIRSPGGSRSRTWKCSGPEAAHSSPLATQFVTAFDQCSTAANAPKPW